MRHDTIPPLLGPFYEQIVHDAEGLWPYLQPDSVSGALPSPVLKAHVVDDEIHDDMHVPSCYLCNASLPVYMWIYDDNYETSLIYVLFVVRS